MNFKLILPLALTAALTACGGPTEFGIPQAQFQKMTPVQKQKTIKEYNQEQKRKAAEKPIWDVLETVAGAVAGSPAVQNATTSTDCHNSAPKKVCHTNADGSVTCTASSSGSCSSFGID